MEESILVLGDIHLGKSGLIGSLGIGSGLNSRIEDQMKLLDWVLERSHELHVSHIIITGDCFEEPKPAPYLITLFIGWLKRCQAYGIAVDIVMGNHDTLRSGNVYTSTLDIITEADLEGVNIYKDISTVFIGSTAFTMMPFRDRKSLFANSNAEGVSLLRDSLVYELASIPKTYHKVVIGHLAIEGSLPIGDEIDQLANELFCPLDMFAGYDAVFMGHIHRPQIMQKVPHIAHIGSMDKTTFAELDHEKNIIIFNCTDGTFDIEVLPTRPLQKISITIPSGVEDTTAYVMEEIEKNGVHNKGIVRLEVVLASQDLKSVNKVALDQYLLSQGASHINGISESKKIGLLKKDDSQNTIDTTMTVESAVKTYSQLHIEESMQPAFIDLALELHLQHKATE